MPYYICKDTGIFNVIKINKPLVEVTGETKRNLTQITSFRN